MAVQLLVDLWIMKWLMPAYIKDTYGQTTVGNNILKAQFLGNAVLHPLGPLNILLALRRVESAGLLRLVIRPPVKKNRHISCGVEYPMLSQSIGQVSQISSPPESPLFEAAQRGK
jgi:hypothetical protein